MTTNAVPSLQLLEGRDVQMVIVVDQQITLLSTYPAPMLGLEIGGPFSVFTTSGQKHDLIPGVDTEAMSHVIAMFGSTIRSIVLDSKSFTHVLFSNGCAIQVPPGSRVGVSSEAEDWSNAYLAPEARDPAPAKGNRNSDAVARD
jgi:hypothetical protein